MLLNIFGYIILILFGLGIAIYIPIYAFKENEGKPVHILGAVALGLAIIGYSISQLWNLF